jgi:general secretion pathway protein N
MKPIRWLLAGLSILLLLAAVLVATAPADLAYRWYADRLGPLRAEGLSGSVWDGRASAVSVFGTALRGAPRGDIALTGELVHGKAALRSAGGALRLEDVEAAFPASVLGPALDIPALILTGNIAVEAAHAELRDGVLQSAEGTATWREIVIAGAAQARVDGLEARFVPAAGGGIEANLRDLSGSLAVDGRVTVHEGRYAAQVRLALRQPDPQVQEALQYIGERMPDGSTLLRIEGTLHPLW